MADPGSAGGTEGLSDPCAGLEALALVGKGNPLLIGPGQIPSQVEV